MRIIEYIAKKIMGKLVIVTFITSIILGVCIATMFFGLLKLKPDATMDSLNFYTSDTFFYNLEIQGKEGRKSYLILHLIDYIFITQFYLFFVYLITLITHALKKKFTKYLWLIPFLPAIMDFFENICIDLSILLFPYKILFIGKLSGIFTRIKMMSINITFLVVLILIGMLIINTVIIKFNKRKT